MIGLIALWIATIPILSYPSYLSYYNGIAGGTKQGYMVATDSNYDWGQDMKRLRVWIDSYNGCVSNEEQRFMPDTAECQTLIGNNNSQFTSRSMPFPTQAPIDRIRVDYFGGADPSYYLGDRYVPWYDERAPEPGWYAVSALFYQESLYRNNPEKKRTYEWLSAYPPIDRAGDSIFIFYIPE